MIALLRLFATEYPLGAAFLAVVGVAGLVVLADEWRRSMQKHDQAQQDELAARRRRKVRDAVNAAYEHEPRWHHWR